MCAGPEQEVRVGQQREGALGEPEEFDIKVSTRHFLTGLAGHRYMSRERRSPSATANKSHHVASAANLQSFAARMRIDTVVSAIFPPRLFPLDEQYHALLQIVEFEVSRSAGHKMA